MSDDAPREDALRIGLNHELRTPLTGIRAAADLLAGGAPGPLSDDQRRWVEEIRKNAERATAVLDDLLAGGPVGGTGVPGAGDPVG